MSAHVSRHFCRLQPLPQGQSSIDCVWGGVLFHGSSTVAVVAQIFFEDIEDLGKAMMNKSPPNLNWQISSNDVYLAVSHYIFGCI
jgi:hypothetical protein